MSGAARVSDFYGRWAAVYDRVARHAPLADRYRAAAADALALDRGDTVVDLGCGTGANFPALRERVGPAGRVVGVDLTPELLDVARSRAAAWDNVHVVRGDAARPPVAGPVDGVVASFLVGLLGDPAAAVETWTALVADGGRVVTLDAAPTDHAAGTLLNPLFGALVAAGAPPGSRTKRPARRLRERVDAAQRALVECTDRTVEERGVLGFVRLTGGEVRGKR